MQQINRHLPPSPPEEGLNPSDLFPSVQSAHWNWPEQDQRVYQGGKAAEDDDWHSWVPGRPFKSSRNPSVPEWAWGCLGQSRHLPDRCVSVFILDGWRSLHHWCSEGHPSPVITGWGAKEEISYRKLFKSSKSWKNQSSHWGCHWSNEFISTGLTQSQAMKIRVIWGCYHLNSMWHGWVRLCASVSTSVQWGF